MPLPGINRNGNLQITQFYYGAAQPSSAAAQIAGALFYGSAQDNGGPGLRPQPHQQRQHHLERPRRRRRAAWPPTSRAPARPTSTSGPAAAAPTPTSSRSYPAATTSAGPSACSRPATACPPPTRSGRSRAVANFAVNPVNGNDVVISSAVGRIFSTTNAGRDLVRHRRPGGLRQPRQLQRRPGLRCARPQRPRGHRQPRQLHLRRHRDRPDLRHPGRRRQRREQQLAQHLPRPQRLGRPVDHHRPHPRQPRRLRRHHHRRVLPHGLGPPGEQPHQHGRTSGSTSPATSTTWPTPSSARPTTRRPTRTRSSSTRPVALSSIVADWRYAIPNNPTDPSPGYHPVLYVGAQLGRLPVARQRQDLDALPQHDLRRRGGGRQPAPCRRHSTSSLSLGNIDPNTGMPNLAGPYNPTNPTATPDPDLLLATTYGRGAFAINLAPLLFPASVDGRLGEHLRDRGRRHADRHDRHADHRRPQRDHRLRQRHLDHDRRRDPRRPDIRAGHRRLRPEPGHARPGDRRRLGQRDQRPRQLRHPDHGRLRIQRPEDDQDLSPPTTPGRRATRSRCQFTLQATDIVMPPPTSPPPAPTLAHART